MSSLRRCGSSSLDEDALLWWRNTGFRASSRRLRWAEGADAGRVSDATKVRVEVQRGGRRRPRLARGHGRPSAKAGAHECAPPFTEAEFEIRWGTGIDATSELLDLGIARGLVDKSGNHLSFAG
jgi:hypothetical protein